MAMAADIDEKVSQRRQEPVDAGAHADAEKRNTGLRGDPGHVTDNGTDSQGSDCPAREVERWNYPRSNVYKTFATFWAFLVMGANDSAYGPLIPYLEEHYNLSYTTVSLVFLSPIGGYTLAALTNNILHLRFGRRGIAILSPGCHLIAYIVNCLHPPYPVLVVSFIFAGLGNGLADSAWNAWIGNMADSNQVLGLPHGWYGLGAVLAPLVATSLITEAKVGWWYFYYIMVACAAIEVGTCVWTFWDSDAASFRTESEALNPGNDGGVRRALFVPRYARVTWLLAFFLLSYVGVEVAIGGWIVTFLMRVRDGGDFASGMGATGYWLGITFGRVVLGFITPKIGEKTAIIIYNILAISFALILWLVPNFYASVIAVSIQGFFLGPMFPGAVVVATRLLPRSMHVSAIGFAAAFGASGAAVLPFAVGAVAQAKGVEVLQPFIVGLSAGMTLLWCVLPRLPKRGLVEQEDEGGQREAQQVGREKGREGEQV
ncbi:major facilitator superfamily domain-containing protein [Aspergillus carlsbadensis]|nr:major facilitator superfamily domain-containing protein [Aspergillus carlsbadensis]